MVVVGSKRMVQYEDSSADESIRIYDRGLEFEEPPSNFGEYRLTYRAGDMVAPRIDAAEPLGLEFQDFARAIREGGEPRSSAAFGLDVVLSLEALQESLELGGAPVPVARAGATRQNGRHGPVAAPANGNGHAGNGYAGNGHAGNGHAGNGHAGNGHNGVGHIMVAVQQRRARDRRADERRDQERRRAMSGPPDGPERRNGDRRNGDRRVQDRRLVLVGADVQARDVA
jgi:hypothetical protein